MALCLTSCSVARYDRRYHWNRVSSGDLGCNVTPDFEGANWRLFAPMVSESGDGEVDGLRADISSQPEAS